MVKVRALKRAPDALERESRGDLRQQTRNLDPQYHPMQRAREYTRAVNAAKMDRMFAKPLIGNLGEGHRDAVTATAVSRRSLLPLVSGSADGEIQLWDLATRSSVARLAGSHSRPVTGLVFSESGQQFYSCSDDGYCHQWSIHAIPGTGSDDSDEEEDDAEGGMHGDRKRRATTASSSKKTKSTTLTETEPTHGPLGSWRTSGSFKSIDHHWFERQFATASDTAVQIWDPTRTMALQTHTDLWGSHDTVTTIRYNPAESNLIAHCSADRGIGLHDTRTGSALKKTVLRMRSNDLQWNPLEPMNFCVANEDFNAYTFDMRNLDKPTRIFKGHVSAVMSVSWSPTGREFATGSYDRTIRLFKQNGGTSRDIYHTKRMQRVFTVQYSQDSKFVVSGSDDSNLRLWKANASEKLGQLTHREESAIQYRQALIKRYQHLPEVRRIHKSRKVPKTIKKQIAQSHIQKESQDRKQANRVKYSKNGEHKFVSDRRKTVVREQD